ncbi:hypothetical protein CASFOL_023471 [Castilleja foliolosa]|uniref:Cyanobacterial aminoacyl-tRNA synthetase CAAD domain-containing protein n=1 Tax=Castilleja foliolosa TaxID=1961234 RepID=A0ABD3CM00_9LAMI
MIKTMELCTVRGISNLPPLHPKHLSSTHARSQSLYKTHAPTRFNLGLQHNSNLSVKSLKSDEISTDPLQYVKDEPKYDGGLKAEDTHVNESPKEEDSLIDNPQQLFKLLEDLNLKFDIEDPYSVLVFGSGGALALWLLSAVVGAVDSIPVLPKVLELVGFGYTLWFSSRYLVFKKNRDELVAIIEQVKQQVIGSENDD